MWVCVFVCLCVVSVFYVTSQILKHHSINDIHSMRCRVSHFTIHTDHVESFLKCISYNGRVRYSSNSNRKDRYLSRSLMFEHFTCNVTNKCTQIHTKWKKKPVVEIFVALSHSLLDWTTVDIVINAITPWTLIVCRFFFSSFSFNFECAFSHANKNNTTKMSGSWETTRKKKLNEKMHIAEFLKNNSCVHLMMR